MLEMKNQRMFQRVLVELKSMVDVVLLYINAVGYVVRIHSSKHVSIYVKALRFRLKIS